MRTHRYRNDIFLPADHAADAEKRGLACVEMRYAVRIEGAIAGDSVLVEPDWRSKAITDVGVVGVHYLS